MLQARSPSSVALLVLIQLLLQLPSRAVQGFGYSALLLQRLL
jgi:hypothetical protein